MNNLRRRGTSTRWRNPQGEIAYGSVDNLTADFEYIIVPGTPNANELLIRHGRSFHQLATMGRGNESVGLTMDHQKWAFHLSNPLQVRKAITGQNRNRYSHREYRGEWRNQDQTCCRRSFREPYRRPAADRATYDDDLRRWDALGFCQIRPCGIDRGFAGMLERCPGGESVAGKIIGNTPNPSFSQASAKPDTSPRSSAFPWV